MKTEDLKALGLEQETIDKIMAMNGKDVNGLKDKYERAIKERDSLSDQLKDANETISGFEGVDPDGLKKEIEDWKAKCKQVEEQAKAERDQRAFDDALNAEIESIQFSSESAKRDVLRQIREAGLPVRNGKIIGLSDMITTIQESDAGAFVNKAEGKRAKFTDPMPQDKRKFTPTELMKMKNENPDFDLSPYFKKKR